MPHSIVAVYESHDQVKNAVDDLVATGIPQEDIRTDQDKPRIAVTVSDAARPEVIEILNRHDPSDVSG
jgi:hypothetical protein